VDWVGAYVPFVVGDRVFNSSGLSDAERKLERERFRSATPIVVPQFLKVRLGVSL
jgi:hypothetical protein